MLFVSPRSYVTAAFDLIFPELLEYVFVKLSFNTNWWKDIVYENKEYIFKNDINLREQLNEDFLPEYYDELFDYFDEHTLCKLVLTYSARRFFDRNDLKVFEELLEIRIQWAHRKYRQPEFYDDEKPKREWAESAINYLRYIAEYVVKNHNIKKQISILLFKMKCDWINDNTKLRSHKELLKWMYEEIIIKVTASDSPVDDTMKQRVKRSFEELEKYADAVSPDTASRYVVDYYWNAIRGKTDVYDEINKHGKIKTFEDVVEEFTKYCYKE